MKRCGIWIDIARYTVGVIAGEGVYNEGNCGAIGIVEEMEIKRMLFRGI